MASRSHQHNNIGFKVVIAALLLGAAYLVYEFGRIQAGYNILAAAEERKSFEVTIDGLELQIVGLKEQITLLETHRDIEKEAYTQIEATLTDLRAQIQDQQDDLAFYRGIVSPADGQAGLRVQDFELTRGPEERNYSVRLVLIQAMKHDRKVSGDVKLQVHGVESGQQKSYDFAELLPQDGDAKWPFSFRYFQDFDRPIVLPDGFTPETVTVQVESRTRSIDSIEASFSWLSSQG